MFNFKIIFGMKIIRIINPSEIENFSDDRLMRVLAFENGCYALHFIAKNNRSHLSLFDAEGGLIQRNVNAESAYVFANGNYILMFEPTNPTAKFGGVRLRREYRMFSKNGGLICDNISYFIPQEDGGVILAQDGRDNLYDASCREVGTLPHRAVSQKNGVSMSGGVWKMPDKAALPSCLANAHDTHVFANGNISCVLGGKLCFFRKGEDEPLVELEFPIDENVCFLPDGRYWLEESGLLCNQEHKAVRDKVDYVADLGDVYVVSQKAKGEQTVFDDKGNMIAGGQELVRKFNGIIAMHDFDGKLQLLLKNGRKILPPVSDDAMVFIQSAI